MSEGKTIIELLNELSDKNFTFSDYFVEIDTVDNTYKMSFETFFSGILAPDPSGNIDIGNNNLINGGNISGADITASGIITANGEGFNLVLPYIVCAYFQDENTSFTLNYGSDPDYYNNHIFTVENTRYIRIPRGKTGQFIMSKIFGNIEKTSTGTNTSTDIPFKIQRKKYDTVLETEADIDEITIATITALSSDPVGTTYPISWEDAFDSIINIKTGLGTNEELRLYPLLDYTSGSLTGEYQSSINISLQGFR